MCVQQELAAAQMAPVLEKNQAWERKFRFFFPRSPFPQAQG